jgi:hypothetical protein
VILTVDSDDADSDFLSLLHDVPGMQEAALGQLGDVDQPFQSFLKSNERPKIDHVGDLPTH